ncbi:major facilitator superfamily domain-containing protein [Dactylonectria estremocensis]|uniref:Major facilitator superfamily domain-containing protein n=1 Tax=Dactylonectria estremocensis TaxID=1079267 RepID=A0A9P9EQJ4_9HYPO|nr:major facilitator superfamily domain-containing protein [Dactylonectria estremocensis]
MAGAIPTAAPQLAGGYLTGRALIFPLSLIISLFFLWGFSYGLLDVLNKHFQTVLGISRLESTGLQVMYFGGGYLLFSPIAAECLKRRGYKQTILMGLALYSLGAILFWPVSHSAEGNANTRAVFGGFCACTLVIACGLATLETAANSYAVVIGKPESASARLQFCQSWNGVASFIGPLVASKAFFSGENQNSLTNVQYVYLAVSCAGAAVAVLFFFAKLPEVSEAIIEDEGHDQLSAQTSFWKQWNMWFATLAQFCYVGAQVTIATFFINYAHENSGYTTARASTMLSFALITFTVGRFVATALAVVLDSAFIMVVYASCAIALTAYVSASHGHSSVIVLILIFAFMSPMYPTIFTLGTQNLGRHTRRAAGVLVMGVSGGAVFPPIQGAIADAYSTRISYVVPTIGFVYVLGYVSFVFVRGGMRVLRVKSSKTSAIEETDRNEKDGAVIEEHEKKGDEWA